MQIRTPELSYAQLRSFVSFAFASNHFQLASDSFVKLKRECRVPLQPFGIHIRFDSEKLPSFDVIQEISNDRQTQNT